MIRVKKLYRFILQTFLPLFLMTFFICLFIVMMQFLWKYIDELVGKGLDIAVIAELFFYAALTMVPMALPLAILLASLMTFGNLGESDVDITTGRVDFWKVAIQQFKENPILGIGWKAFWHFEFFGANYDVHNIYLQLLCEVGIVGSILFYLLFVMALYRAIKIVIRKNIDEKYKKVALFSVFYQVFFLLYGITGNPLYDASFYIMYFISIALIVPQMIIKLPKTEDSHENSNHHVSSCL